MSIASLDRSRASLNQICIVAESFARSSFTEIQDSMKSVDGSDGDSKKKVAEITSCVEKRLAVMEGIMDRFAKLRCVSR